MSCAEFESLLLEADEPSAEARAHAAGCSACRAFLESLGAIDEGLQAAYGGAEVSPGFRESRRSSRCGS